MWSWKNYIIISSGHLGMFEEWCKTFDPDEHKGEISELLVNVPEIRALYAKLVCEIFFINWDPENVNDE